MGIWIGSPASSAYVRPPQASVALLGDSITDKNLFTSAGAYYAYQDEGYWTWAAIALGQRMRLAGVFGYSGQTTATIFANAGNAIATGAGWLVEEGGTNDVTGGISAATIQANKLAIWQAALSAGMRVVATTIIPQTSWTAAQRLVAQTVNAWIRGKAVSMAGVHVCNWDVPLTDPATGNAASGMLRVADGIHPTPTAASLMGARLAALLDPLVPKLDILGSGSDPTNILTNGGMTGNSSGISTGWNIKNVALGTATATPTKVTRTDDVPTEWQQLVVAPADTTGVTFYRTLTTGFTPGDTVSGYWEYQRGSDWANIPTSGTNQFRLRLSCQGGSALTGYALNHVGPEAFPASTPPLSGVLKTPPLVIPAGVTALQFAIEFTGQGTVRLGRGGIRLNQPW